jgi:hypothetical protein
MQDEWEIKQKEHWMKNDVCVFCYGLENGRAVLLCSTCVQRLLSASSEKIAEMKRAFDVTDIQLRYLNSLSEEEEIQYEHTTRKPRQNLDRARTGRAAKSAH